MLVVVLGVLALLTVMVLGFSHRALLERRAAAVSLDHAQALAMARGATERGISFLRSRAAVGDSRDRRDREPGLPYWRDHPSPVDEGLFEVDPETGDTVDYEIEDLESRVSLNSAPEALFEESDLFDMKLIGEIMERRGVGVTSKPPQPFVAVEELRTLGDFDDDEWLGSADEPGLCDLLTTWGDGRINLNTASPEVLMMIPDISDSVVQGIVEYRKGPDAVLGTKDDRSFASFEDVAKQLAVSAERLSPLRRYCKLDSSFFTITGYATRRQGKVRASCTATVELRDNQVFMLQWREDPVGS